MESMADTPAISSPQPNVSPTLGTPLGEQNPATSPAPPATIQIGTPINDKLQRALAYFEQNTTRKEFFINPSMFLYIWPCTFDKEDNLIASIPRVNHNNIDAGIVYDIMNNMMGDVCKVSPQNKPEMGDDLELFAIQWNKVRLK